MHSNRRSNKLRPAYNSACNKWLKPIHIHRCYNIAKICSKCLCITKPRAQVSQDGQGTFQSNIIWSENAYCMKIFLGSLCIINFYGVIAKQCIVFILHSSFCWGTCWCSTGFDTIDLFYDRPFNIENTVRQKNQFDAETCRTKEMRLNK